MVPIAIGIANLVPDSSGARFIHTLFLQQYRRDTT